MRSEESEIGVRGTKEAHHNFTQRDKNQQFLGVDTPLATYHYTTRELHFSGGWAASVNSVPRIERTDVVDTQSC